MSDNSIQNVEEKKFIAFKKFLETDISIKRRLIELVPKNTDFYDEDSKIKYLDKVYETIKDFKDELIQSARNFGFSDNIIEALDSFFNELNSQFLLKGTDIKEIYQQLFSNMNNSFIENVKKQCVGYTRKASLASLINEASTVNELLHCMHSYIINNYEILQSMPKLGSKGNTAGYPITLYGDDTEVARKIFEEFPLKLDVAWTDIVSTPNKIIMMVRDRGHALSIEIDLSDSKKYFVKYFVPKLCNKQMIENLKGVNKGKITDNGATGQFEVESEEITNTLYRFIEMVPTDLDIPEVQAFYSEINNVPSKKEYTETDIKLAEKKDKGIDEESEKNEVQIDYSKTTKQKMAEYVKNTFLYKISWIRNLVDKILQEKFLQEGNDSNVYHLKKPIPGIRQQDGKPYTINMPPIDLDNRKEPDVEKMEL